MAASFDTRVDYGDPLATAFKALFIFNVSISTVYLEFWLLFSLWDSHYSFFACLISGYLVSWRAMIYMPLHCALPHCCSFLCSCRIDKSETKGLHIQENHINSFYTIWCQFQWWKGTPHLVSAFALKYVWNLFSIFKQTINASILDRDDIRK